MTLDDYIRKSRKLRSNPQMCSMIRISGCRCIHVNRKAFFSDLPHAEEALGRSQEELYSWFEDRFSLLSEAQAQHAGTFFDFESPPDFSETVAGFRTHAMGRTTVVEVEVAGKPVAFELKGCGVRESVVPTQDIHENGFQGLMAGSREYLISCLIGDLFDGDEGSRTWRPSKIYAILLTSVQCSRAGKRVPCTILVREPTPRDSTEAWPAAGSTAWESMVDVEIFLRSFGFTSVMSTTYRLGDGHVTDARRTTIIGFTHQDDGLSLKVQQLLDSVGIDGPFEASLVNIQICEPESEGEPQVVVDMEHFKPVHGHPALPLVFPAGDRLFGFGGTDSGFLAQLEVDSADSVAAGRLGACFALVDSREEFDSYFWCDRLSAEGKIYSIWGELLERLEGDTPIESLQAHFSILLPDD
jgi:hypothetical protein